MVQVDPVSDDLAVAGSIFVVHRTSKRFVLVALLQQIVSQLCSYEPALKLFGQDMSNFSRNVNKEGSTSARPSSQGGTRLQA